LLKKFLLQGKHLQLRREKGGLPKNMGGGVGIRKEAIIKVRTESFQFVRGETIRQRRRGEKITLKGGRRTYARLIGVVVPLR